MGGKSKAFNELALGEVGASSCVLFFSLFSFVGFICWVSFVRNNAGEKYIYHDGHEYVMLAVLFFQDCIRFYCQAHIFLFWHF